MTTYTNLEIRVFNEIVDLNCRGYGAEFTDLAANLGIPQSSLKGVLGSLVKKELIEVDKWEVEGRSYSEAFPIINGESKSHLHDFLTDAEINELKLKEQL